MIPGAETRNEPDSPKTCVLALCAPTCTTDKKARPKNAPESGGASSSTKKKKEASPERSLEDILLGDLFDKDDLTVSIIVKAGEDIAAAVSSICDPQGDRGFIILAATGLLSSVKLRSPDLDGTVITYEADEGHFFEIVSLTGSVRPAESEGSRIIKSDGMWLICAASGHRPFEGSVAGVMMAASNIQGRFQIHSLSGSFTAAKEGGHQLGGIKGGISCI